MSTDFYEATRRSILDDSHVSVIFVTSALLGLYVIVYIADGSGAPVSIVSGYGLYDQAIEVRSPADAKWFFL
jgi:hypothetical protein